MKFSVDMTLLRSAVKQLKPAMGTAKSDLVVLLTMFEVENDILRLFVTDKEMFAITEISLLSSQVNGRFSMLSSKLLGLVSEVKTEIVNFSVDEENVCVEAGFLNVNFDSYDSDKLQVLRDQLLSDGHAMKASLDRAQVVGALLCSKTCATATDLRPELGHLEVRNGKILSSDGSKIMVVTAQNLFDEGLVFKIPTTSLNAVVDILKHCQSPVVDLYEGNSYYRLEAAPTIVGVRRVERSFYAVEDVLEKLVEDTNCDNVVVDSEVFRTMLRGVALGLSSDDSRITIDLYDEETGSILEVSSYSRNRRRSFERTTCGRSVSHPITFPVSYKHLVTSLTAFEGDSVVDLRVFPGWKFLVLEDNIPDRQVQTIIPFRTDDKNGSESVETETVPTSAILDVDDAPFDD